MALYVLESARDPATRRALTPAEAARAHGEDGGIDSLLVFIGANNALGTVLELQVRWSDEGYDDPARKGAYNVWRPGHFEADKMRPGSRYFPCYTRPWIDDVRFDAAVDPAPDRQRGTSNRRGDRPV